MTELWPIDSTEHHWVSIRRTPLDDQDPKLFIIIIRVLLNAQLSPNVTLWSCDVAGDESLPWCCSKKKKEVNISACLTYCKSHLFQESPSAMVRTQQNSRRSTGGHATCAKWADSLPVKTSSSCPKPHHKHPERSGNNNVGSLPHYQCGIRWSL